MKGVSTSLSARVSGSRIARLNALICLLSILLNYCIPGAAYAQGNRVTPGPANPYSAALTATRHIKPLTNTVYNDELYAPANGTPWNCANKFLMRAYAGDAIDFDFFGASAYNAGLNALINDVRITNATGTVVYNNIVYGSLFSYTFPTKGWYKIYYSHIDPVSHQRVQDINGELSIQPKLEKLWLEAPEVCAADYVKQHYNQPYQFKLKSTPLLTDIMRAEDFYHAPGTAGNCIDYQKTLLSVKMTTGYSPGDVDLYSAQFGNITTAQGGELGFLGTAYTASFINPFPPDLENYYINYADLVKFFPGGYYFPYGNILPLTFTVDDGIDLYSITAPLIITAPKSSGSTVPAFSSYHDFSKTINGNETWTPQDNPVQKMYGNTQTVYRIQKTLRIPAGKTLTIRNMQIEFGPDGKIDIETEPGTGKPGGMLRLDNTTLTGMRSCGFTGNTWAGINVWGDASKDQNVINSSTGQAWQGTLNVTNNSKISFARWAVTNVGPQKSLPYDRDGGIIYAANSTFENNVRSVNYGPYPAPGIAGAPLNKPYYSSFTNCDFKADGNLPTAFIGFIGGWAVKGVAVYGCRFVNNGATPAGGYNLGVYGSDFGVWIDRKLASVGTGAPAIRSAFYNLDKGVNTGNTSGSAGTSVQYADFGNNKIGIQTDGVQAPVTRYNLFRVAGGTAAVNGLGVFVNSGSMYDISSNSFVPVSGAAYTTGVLISKSGSDNNVVHTNDYNGLWCANLSNYLNRNPNPNSINGLQFLCNTNSNNRHDIAARSQTVQIINGIPVYSTGGSPVDGIAGNQGAASKAAGNTFSGGALYNIYNPGFEVQVVNYYYVNGQMPNTRYGANAILAARPNSCLYSDPSGGDGSTSGGGPILSGGRIAHFLNDPEGIPYRDSLYLALADWISPYSDLLKTDLLIEDGNYTAADATYNSIVNTYSLIGNEGVEFTHWGRQLINICIALRQAGKSSKDLSAAQVQSLEAVADSAQLWAKVRAQNWLKLYDDRQAVPDMLFPQDTASGNVQQRMIRPTTASHYNLSPNPATGQLQISFNKEQDADQVFSLTDLTGRVVSHTTLTGRSGNVYLDIRHLQPGVYLYRITGGGSTIFVGKVTKQ